MIADRTAFDPQSSEPLPASSKVYVSGKLHPDIRVPLREIKLADTKGMNGRTEVNASVRVYDCSGPWGEQAFAGQVGQGLPPLRESWIGARGDVEPVAKTYVPVPGRSTVPIPPTLQRQA